MGFKKIINDTTSLLGFHNPKLTRFIRYNFAAGIATFMDIFLYWISVAFIGIYYLLAGTITFIIGLTINYSLNRVWTFKGTKRKFISGFIYFSFIGTSALIIALLFLAFFVEVLNFNYLLARILVVLIVIPWNYFLNVLITFK